MFWLLCLFAYLTGSLSFALLLSRRHGLRDPRASGSGNPGASNMWRLAGRRLALLTLLGDLGKGLLPVLIAHQAGLDLTQQAWIGLAAVCGHLYPVFFRFRGGKGVATTAGMLFGLSFPLALLASGIWLTAFALTRTSSLAALLTLPVLPPAFAWYHPEAIWPILILGTLVIWRHRRNLRDLMAGRERHF